MKPWSMLQIAVGRKNDFLATYSGSLRKNLRGAEIGLYDPNPLPLHGFFQKEALIH